MRDSTRNLQCVWSCPRGLERLTYGFALAPTRGTWVAQVVNENMAGAELAIWESMPAAPSVGYAVCEGEGAAGAEDDAKDDVDVVAEELNALRAHTADSRPRRLMNQVRV
eukprot:283986-Pleurochrysis_carterae.AAC.1